MRLFGLHLRLKQPFNPYLQVANFDFGTIFTLICLRNHCGTEDSNMRSSVVSWSKRILRRLS